jgi:hypothetical protein
MAESAPNDVPVALAIPSLTETTVPATDPAQPIQLRLAVAFAMAAWGAFIAYFALSTAPEHLAKDFSWPWRAARALLDHQNPYGVIRPTGPYPFNAAFFYPLPAAIAALPFALFQPAVAGAGFVGLSSGLLAFGLARSRGGLAKLPLFASAPFCMAALLAQWSPLIMAGAVIPSLQFLGAAKPNVALPCFAYRPTRRGLMLGAIFVAVSLAILPTWPFDWRDALRDAPRYRAPITYFGGPILLLAALRWRRAEARTLLVMSVMPQLTLFYDQLPLWLVPTTFWRSIALSALSWVAWAQWYPSRAIPNHVAVARPWIFGLLYLPALIIVLAPSDMKLGRWRRDSRSAELP